MAVEVLKFSHLVMQVSDLARSVDFYHGLLGLEKLFERSFTDPRNGRSQQVVGCLAAGVTPLMPPTEMAPGIYMIFLRDPDGRTIELAEFAGGATSSVEYTRARG